jgi:ribonuclease BN (tRNA processing enzyme)
MYLTVLGRYGPYPRANGACSGYLIEDGGTRVLVDCGAGVFARLCEYMRADELDAIVLSHMHFDHCSDLLVMRYALDQQTVPPGGLKKRIPLYTPSEPRTTAEILTRGLLFDHRTVQGGDEITIGSIVFAFYPMAHPVPTNGMRITGKDGHTLFFTGDTKEFPGLAELAKGADALLADACFVDESQTGPHLNVKQVCALAREANVGTLYCTHLWGKVDTEESIKKEIDFSPAFVVQERGRYCV